MKNLAYIFLIVILSLSKGEQCFAQNYADKNYYLVDSLDLDALRESDKQLIASALKKYHKAKDDTSKVNALNNICEKMMHDDWCKYQLFQYHLIKKILATHPPTQVLRSLNQSLANALNNIGYIYKNQGDPPNALEYYHKSLKIQEEIGDKKGIATSLNNIGYVYKSQGDISQALEHYHKSLKIKEEIGDKKGIATSLNNIGSVYQHQGDIPQALEYYHESLKIQEKIGNKKGIAYSLSNIGVVYKHQGDIPNALNYYHKSLKIQEEIGDKKGIANSLNNIGLVYKHQGEIPNALKYYRKSLKIQEEIGNKQGIAYSLNNIGDIGFSKEDNSGLEAAKKHFQKALELGQEIGSPKTISAAASGLSKVYEKQDKGLLALEMYKLHVQMKDSINNEETQKAAIRQQTKYEFEKVQIVKENKAKEQERIEAEATGRRNNLQYSFIFLGILVLFGGVLSLGFIKVSANIAEGIIFFAFLILFEFVLVFSEPYLEQYTNGEPMYNLLANSVLALVIFPLHAILEKLLKKRIVKD